MFHSKNYFYLFCIVASELEPPTLLFYGFLVAELLNYKSYPPEFTDGAKKGGKETEREVS